MAEIETPNEKFLISASEYFSLMENTPLSLMVFSKDGKLVFINKGGRDEYFLKDTDDISTWDWLVTVKESYRDAARGKIQRVLQGETVALEFEHTPEGSKYAWRSGFMSPIKDEHGATKAIFFYSTDITAMKRVELEAKDNQVAMLNILEDARDMEEELRKAKENVERQVQERTRQLQEEESRLTASINGLSLGFIMVDRAGKVIIANKAIDRFFTSNAGESIFDAAIRSLKEGFDMEASYKKVVSGKKQIDIKRVPSDGKYLKIFMEPIFFVEPIRQPVSGAGNDASGQASDGQELIGVVILIEDITEQELLAESKSNFLAIASHEMRTPLAIIRGDAELLLELIGASNTDTDVLRYVSGVHENSIRLLDILNDFIDVTHMDEKPLELKKEPVNIPDLVNDIIVNFDKAVSEKKIYLIFRESAAPLPLVLADTDRTREVIMNIISNAIHYTDHGGITVVGSPVVKEGKNFLKISITDTGIGIPKENQSMLFKKFSTVSKTFLHTKEYGSGLGLYIAKTLSESMGGSIELEKSAPHEGSIFSVILPVAGELGVPGNPS